MSVLRSYSLSQQVFKASVQFYVILVQVTKELVGAENLSDADQLENKMQIQFMNYKLRLHSTTDVRAPPHSVLYVVDTNSYLQQLKALNVRQRPPLADSTVTRRR